MNSKLEDIEALLPDFQYVDSDENRIVLTVGFAATFYFWNGHTSATREAIVRCFEAFEAAFGEHLKWAFDADSAAWVDLSENRFVTLKKHVETLDEDDAIEWHLTSGEDPDAVGDYVISCLTEPGWEENYCSVFRFQVPRSLAFEREGAQNLFDLMRLCSVELAPFHGNAGLNVVAPYEEIVWEAEKFDVATRYLGLYIDSPTIDQTPAPRGIKGINWLTFISNKLTECLGGPASFVNYCRKFGVETIVVGNGFMVQAGEYPQLGPVGTPPPEEYVKANAALRPLRNGNFGSMGSGSISGEMRFDLCTSDLWIRRFDSPNTWPPKTFIGLPRAPLGAAPRKKIKLKTGEECTVHGRYRELGFVTPPDFGDEDIAPMVVLLPGDVAPYRLELGPHGELLGRKAIKWELIAEL